MDTAQESGLPPRDRRVWVVRAGRAAVNATDFLTQGICAIGFDVDENLSGLDQSEISGILKKVVPDDSAVAIGLAAGALNRFVNEFSVGDILVTPEPRGSLLIGELRGQYEYRAEAPIEDHHHVREVRWFSRLARSGLSDPIQNSLGSALTVFVVEHEAELLKILLENIGGPVPAPKPAVLPKTKTTVDPVLLPSTPLVPAGPSGGHFETDKKALIYLLDKIQNRDLALPDFQRSFVWDAGATRELVVSIIRDFPAGTLLLLRGGSNIFYPRAVEGAPDLDDHEPEELVLDGQQRLSSLYQAFSGVGAHRFFIDIGSLIHGDDIDNAVKAYSVRQAKPWSSIESQARSLVFPLERVREFAYWRDEVVELRGEHDLGDGKALRGYLNEFEKAVIDPIRQYEFPLTRLSSKTPVEAVCTIFETLNRTGIKLTAFELICARAFAEGYQLRERWKDALSSFPILDEFAIDPYYLLQAIALRSDLAPRRGEVLGMDLTVIDNQWDSSVEGMARALTMLRDECGVLTAKWLPYAPMIPTLAAIWQRIEDSSGAAVGGMRKKLQRWFWCVSFSGDYSNAPNSRAEADMPILREWLDGGSPPTQVSDFSFDSSTWLDATGRQRGLYRSTMALMMRHHPLDFHKAAPLTKEVIDTTGVDDHHIFPAAYLKEQGMTGHADTILNHTLIDKTTNILIGKKAPSVYLGQMSAELKSDLDSVLRSHGLPVSKEGPLWKNDFDSFLEWRMEYLESALLEVTGDPEMNADR